MRIKSLLVSTVLCFPFTAFAADLPAKAQPPAAAPSTPTPTSYPTWNGLYGGVSAFGESASSSIQTSAGTTNLNTAGAGVGGVFGYQYKVGSGNIGFTEVEVDYTNLGGNAVLSNGASGSVSGPWGVSLTTGIGANWLMLLQAPYMLFGGASPQSLFPALPNGVTAVSSLPYVSLSADFNDVQANVSGLGGNSQWQVTPAPGFGILTTLSNGTAIDTRFKYEFGNTSLNLGPGTAAQKGGTLWFEAVLKM